MWDTFFEQHRVGDIVHGKVLRTAQFGAFIEILPGRDGLCHISELDDKYVGKVEDVCKVGDHLQVKVIAIDDQDRVKLSRKVLLREQNKPAPGARESGGPREGRGEGREGGYHGGNRGEHRRSEEPR